MPQDRHRRSVIILGSMLATSLAVGAIAGPVAAGPDPEQVQQQAERAELRAERKAEREALRAERKAERALLLEERKAALEARKTEAKAMREETRAAIAKLFQGFGEMTVEDRRAALDEMRLERWSLRDALHVLMADWQADHVGGGGLPPEQDGTEPEGETEVVASEVDEPDAEVDDES